MAISWSWPWSSTPSAAMTVSPHDRDGLVQVSHSPGAAVTMDPSDPLGSLSDPYWKRQEEFKTEYDDQFNNGVREITILVLIVILLCGGSFAFLSFWRRRRERDDDLLLPYSWEDQMVYKVSFSLCAFSLAVSVGAALLLPVSTISNEILHRYPSSWYIKWLNGSLIQGIWNLIFLLSNFCLFLFLPFAYLFCESEGLPFFGHKKGLVARAKETMVTLMLLSLIILGMMYVLAALLDRDRNSINTLLNVYSYLPFLYSCVSFLGVVMLLICTPLGFARLFSIVGDLVIRPNLLRNLDEDYYTAKFEEDCLRQKLSECREGHSSRRIAPLTFGNGDVSTNNDGEPYNRLGGQGAVPASQLAYYERSLEELTLRRMALDQARHTPLWRRILGYPLVLLVLTALTSASLLCVVLNFGQIIAGFRTLPGKQVVDLGLTSLTALGVVGVFVEVVLIGYLLVTSVIGLYTIPLIRRIKPLPHATSLTHLILNCALFLVLSSALPLQSRILGITNFDLLGSFAEVRWLDNFYIVLLYNAVFAAAAAACLITHFTAPIRREIGRRFTLVFHAIVPMAKIKRSSRACCHRIGSVAKASSEIVQSLSQRYNWYKSALFGGRRRDGPKFGFSTAAPAIQTTSGTKGD